MSLGNELLEVAFFEQGVSATEQIEKIDELGAQIALRGIRNYRDILDAAVATDIAPIEALLLQYDPTGYAEDTWQRSQELSTRILSMNGVLSTERARGASTEVAVHNLIWYGIARQKFGRYARLTTHAEDASEAFGRRDGYDILFRSDRRRWQIQVKQSGNPEEIQNKYEPGIIVVSPEILLRQRNATSDELHAAVATNENGTLQLAWNNFLHELRTQKAPNGVRRVI